jgi:hypothetical protein
MGEDGGSKFKLLKEEAGVLFNLTQLKPGSRSEMEE